MCRVCVYWAHVVDVEEELHSFFFGILYLQYICPLRLPAFKKHKYCYKHINHLALCDVLVRVGRFAESSAVSIRVTHYFETSYFMRALDKHTMDKQTRVKKNTKKILSDVRLKRFLGSVLFFPLMDFDVILSRRHHRRRRLHVFLHRIAFFSRPLCSMVGRFGVAIYCYFFNSTRCKFCFAKPALARTLLLMICICNPISFLFLVHYFCLLLYNIFVFVLNGFFFFCVALFFPKMPTTIKNLSLHIIIQVTPEK